MALRAPRSPWASGHKVLRRWKSPGKSVQAAPAVQTVARQLSTSACYRFEQEAAPGPVYRPRWSYTPERMIGPGFSINVVKDPRRTIWRNNDDPDKLDDMYRRFLGQHGDKMLPEEVKWLAVTHKSFDQGRRGYNTRLAYYGRLTLSLEATRTILASSTVGESLAEDAHGRVPFHHPALDGFDNLSLNLPKELMHKEKIAKMAVEIGLPAVVRWKPRLPENLEASGFVAVLNTTLFAIIGAISLQRGAEVAGRVVRDKILRRLGA